MKKATAACWLTILLFIAASCRKDNSTPSENTISPSALFHNVDSVKSILKRAGFDTSAIYFYDNVYTVEYDLAINERAFKEITERLSTGVLARHAHSHNLLSLTHRNITIGFSSTVRNSTYFIKWYNAVVAAARHWNSLPSCNINIMVNGDATSADVLIEETSDNTVYAKTWFPYADGSTTEFLYVNSPASASRSALQDVIVIVHEIGHILGLRHTDWDVFPAEPAEPVGAVYFPGIATNDASSIMRSDIGVLGWAWNGFSQLDIVAANALYPVDPAMIYKNIIVGPAVVPAVGNLTHNCGAYYTGFNYDWRLFDMNDNLLHDFDDVNTATLEWGGGMTAGQQYKLQCRLVGLESPGEWSTLIVTAQ